MLKYKRVLLKLTGEMFGGDQATGIDFSAVARMAAYIKFLKAKYQLDIAIVPGGGNLFRGRNVDSETFDRAQADYIGMLGTIMNGLALQGELERLKVKTRVMSALHVDQACEPFIRRKALSHLDDGMVVILVGGSGRPYFTTDTAAALYAIEIGCEIFLKGSNVDGIYTADPNEDETAVKYSHLTFREALINNLMVMDDTAFALCKGEQIAVIVFDVRDLANIERILLGQDVGTIVT